MSIIVGLLRAMLEGLNKLRDAVTIARSHGNWDYDPYLHGMANGLICALAIMEEKNPEYLSPPERWLHDIYAEAESTDHNAWN